MMIMTNDRKKIIKSINSKGRISNVLNAIYEITLKPFLETFIETGKSQAILTDEFFHTATRSFFEMRAEESFRLPGALVHGSKKIPGTFDGREVKKGDILIVRRDKKLDRIEIARLDLSEKPFADYTFEISYAELKFCMDRCEYV